MAAAIKPRAIMEVNDGIHLRGGDNLLNACHRPILGVVTPQAREFAIEIAVHPPGTADNTGEVEIGYHPQIAPANPIIGHQE